MLFILITTAALFVVALTGTWVVMGGFLKRRRLAEGFWKRLFRVQLYLLPLYVFGLVPGFLGYTGSRLVQTRKDEQGYAGPILDAENRITPQARKNLITTAPAGSRRLAPIHFANPAGRKLRGFFIESFAPKPKFTAVLMHGLFRNAMEVEPVAAMFRRNGGEVLIVEMSNHGGSARHTFTFGLTEKDDIHAAVSWLRQRPGGLKPPLILFGVSLGGVATCLAAPEIDELRGLVIDAPMTDLKGTVHRELDRFLKFPGWYRSLIMAYIESWSDFDMEDVKPIDALRRLPADLPVLLLGAGHDNRVPTEVVRECYAALPSAEGIKQLWIDPEARHGRIWIHAPTEYEARIHELVQRVLR